MNKEQLDAIRLHSKLTVGASAIGVAKSIARIDGDTYDVNFTQSQYINYLTVNSFKP